jgi:histidyl-tRNA synthetase
MVEEKGLLPEVADRIGTFVRQSGEPKALWQHMMDTNLFGQHEGALGAMHELQILFDYLEAMGSLQHVSFDMSLARGLDYYTGVIYEAVLTDGASQVGSIAAGGRYDNLVGMFSPSGVQTPCVGVSVGIERVFTIMERKAEEMKMMQASNIQVYVASIGPDLLKERMKIARLLWNANIATEYSHSENPKLKRQLDDVLERGIAYMVIFGKDELLSNKLKLKNVLQHTEEEVSYDTLVEALLRNGCVPVSAGTDLSFMHSIKAREVGTKVSN